MTFILPVFYQDLLVGMQADGLIGRYFLAGKIFYSLDDRTMNRALSALSTKKGLFTRSGMGSAKLLGVLFRSSPSLLVRIVMKSAAARIRSRKTFSGPNK